MIRLKSIVLDPDWLPKMVNFIFAGIALLLVGVSLIRPWYAIPGLSFLQNGEVDFITTDSSYTLFFKVALIIVTLCFLLGVFIFRKHVNSYGGLLIRYTITCFIITLWFPTWLALRDADTIGDGAWLQQQHDTMTWLGGDTYRAHAERSIDLGTGVNAQDPPERLAVYRPPTGSLGISRLNDWIWWLGYGPAFTQFVGKGWFYAICGYGLGTVCLFGFYWRRHIPRARKLLKKLITFLSITSSITVGISVSLVVICKYQLSKAEKATAHGNYSQARQSLTNAIRIMPSLINDSGIIRQLGYYDAQLGNDESDFAQLYQISWLEDEGYYGRARKVVNNLSIKQNDMNRAAARELSRHHLRIAINFINSGRYLVAREHLDHLLEQEPNSPQAYFHRQLIATQTGELETNRRIHELLQEVYKGYKSKNKRSVISASWWMLSQGELNAGNLHKAREARMKSQGQ